MSCEKGMLTGHKISGVRFVLVDGKSDVFYLLPRLSRRQCFFLDLFVGLVVFQHDYTVSCG